MIENQALLSLIIANPDDDRHRLLYADWLEQHGQRDRARLIRVQIELACLPANTEAPAALQNEEDQLKAVCEKSLPQLDGIRWGGLERGLVNSVNAVTAAAFRHHSGSIAEVGSVHRVSFKKPDDFAVLAEAPALSRFTDLSVCDDFLCRARNGDPSHRFNDDLQTVLASPHFPRLRRLELTACQLGPIGAKALANCPRLESLNYLNLHDNYIGDEGMAALAASPYLSALRTLRISENDLGPAGVEALALSATLGGLEVLFFGGAIGPAAAQSLARSPYLTRLRELSLDDEIGATGAAALAEAPHLAQLTHLNIFCDIGPAGAQALAASPYLCRLKSLRLPGCGIGDEGADALARSPILAGVEFLELYRNDLTDEGARALAVSPYLTCLEKEGLCMGYNDRLTEAGWQALCARFGDQTDIHVELINAAAQGNVADVAVLLAAGANVNVCNERGETPLSYACAYNHLAAARLLVARGADINSIDRHGYTPLDSAVCSASHEFREWLIGIGGKRNQDYEPWPWPPPNAEDGLCANDEASRT